MFRIYNSSMLDKENFAGDDISFRKLFTPLTTSKVITILIIVGISVYGFSLFNGFVWDDLPFIIENTQIHKFNLSFLLGNNMFNNGPFYRPIPAIYFSALYTFFAANAFFYHAVQLFLHLVGTFFLYLFFTKFLRKSIALFLSLVFLVHPINTESVVYIGSTQSQLYFIPGILALILNVKPNLSKLRLFSIALCLFLSIMTKEVGFLFILLAIGYRFIFGLNSKINIAIVSIALIGLYALMRLGVGGVSYEEIDVIPIVGLNFFERLISIPAIIFYYIRTFVFPADLAVWQIWVIKYINIYNFILPLVISIFTFAFFVYGAVYLLRIPVKEEFNLTHELSKNKNQKATHSNFQVYIFFMLWFFIGLGLLLQFVPLNMTVADRWFYFPIVGLLGMIGVIIQHFLVLNRKYFKIFILAGIIALCLLSLRSYVRTFDWKNNFTLYTRDIKGQEDNFFLISNLGEVYTKAGLQNEAIYYLNKSLEMSPKPGFLNNLGLIYQSRKEYKKSLSYFERAIKLSKTMKYEDRKRLALYINNAYTLLLDDRPAEAIIFIENEGLKNFPENVHLYTILAIAESKSDKQGKALETITKAYKMSKNRITADVYYKITNNIPVLLTERVN